MMQASFATEPIIITTVSFPDSEIFKTSELFIAEVSNLMGVKLKLISCPVKRAVTGLEKGNFFADLAMNKPIAEKIPNTIMLKEPIITLPIYAYSATVDFKVDGWKSLEPYKIVSVEGFAENDIYLKGYDVHLVDNEKSAFKFISSKRAEVFTLDILTAQPMINSFDSTMSNIKRLEPAVDYINLYTVVSLKDPKLAKKFQGAITHLNKEGSVQKLMLRLLGK